MSDTKSGPRSRSGSGPRIVKTDAEWAEKLSPAAFHVTRRGGTERAGSGPHIDEHREGTFSCVCCGAPLFEARAKFESGTGWPSFFEPIAADAVREHEDRGLLARRTEIRCAACEAHLGHVFADGPEPTGLRYCMNGVALTFSPFRPDQDPDG